MSTTSDLDDYKAITNLLISNYLKGAISGKGSEMRPTFHNDATWYGCMGTKLWLNSHSDVPHTPKTMGYRAS